jgi:uncharacterized protein YneF (UPF0154 family)
MEKKTQVLVIAVLLIALFYGISSGFFFQDESVVFHKKQECSKHYDLVHSKLRDNPRIFEGETYTLNEIFYSPKMDTCLYAYVIPHEAPLVTVYNIDDVFGGNIFAGSVEWAFYEEIAKLK